MRKPRYDINPLSCPEEPAVTEVIADIPSVIRYPVTGTNRDGSHGHLDIHTFAPLCRMFVRKAMFFRLCEQQAGGIIPPEIWEQILRMCLLPPFRMEALAPLMPF
jgi:hypothetical protein